MQPLVCRFRLGRALGESALTLLMVFGTIAAGHLMVDAARARHLFSTIGFLALFLSLPVRLAHMREAASLEVCLFQSTAPTGK